METGGTLPIASTLPETQFRKRLPVARSIQGLPIIPIGSLRSHVGVDHCKEHLSMSRECRAFWAILLSFLTLTGCTPSRTFYFHEDGELNYYKGMAKEIEYPDLEGCTLADVTHALPPASLCNLENCQFWDLCLQDAIQTTMANSKVLRLLPRGTEFAEGVLANPNSTTTVYDLAINQTNPGQVRNHRNGPIGSGLAINRFNDGTAVIPSNRGAGLGSGRGIESALSDFDAQFAANMLWQHNEQPRNVTTNFDNLFARTFYQDQANFQAELTKQTAAGTSFAVRHNTAYDLNNSPTRDVPSDYNVNFEVEANQPFLQGAGVLFNRMPVVIARLDEDITLTQFEGQVRNLVRDVEDTYWDLYAAYRQFDAARTGRDAVLRAWRRVKALADVGALGGGALEEARARQEYLLFKSQTEQALRNVYQTEAHLRYLMGLAHTDGRMIRPCDEPTTARIDFDWCQAHNEALARHVNLRTQKWEIKKEEMQLIAARNYLLPRLDGVARYRWLGLGDDLIDPDGKSIEGNSTTIEGTDAWATMTSGDYQEWDLGLRFNWNIGFRQELARVRHMQLRLARERAILQDEELAVSHNLAQAIRDLCSLHIITESLFNRQIAANREVAAAQAIFDEGAELQSQGGTSILDRLLDAQRRRAEAERDYFNSLVAYNQAITEVHFRKCSILEYNNVYLSEGPWPCKAYTDAYNRARERDAGLYLNYGYSRPSVVSRGPYDQFGGQNFGYDGGKTPTAAEQVPTPKPQEEMPPPDRPMEQRESVLLPGPTLGMENQPIRGPILSEPAPIMPEPPRELKTQPAGFRPPRPISR